MMKYSIYLFLVLVITSCQSRFSDLMQGGEVAQSQINESIPFDLSGGIPLIKVEIQGNEYTFLFDTGAPNVLSQELYENIRTKVVASPEIGDSQGNNKQKQIAVRIDTITIGNTHFIDQGAVVIDYNKVFELSCLQFDGIIGSNLMSKLYWELDYEKETVRFTDELANLEIEESTFKLPFTERYAQRKPVVDVSIGKNIFSNVTFDTGASGAFGLVDMKHKSLIDSLASVTMIGSNTVGVYGDGGFSTNRYGLVDTVRLGNLLLEQQVIEFESQGSKTLGNTFLKNYRVGLDWNNKLVYLTPYDKGYSDSGYESFGFSMSYRDGKMIVSGLVEGSEAEEIGLTLGTQLIRLNEMNLRDIDDAGACELGRSKPLKHLQTVDITFLKEGKEVNATLEKVDYIALNKENE